MSMIQHIYQTENVNCSRNRDIFRKLQKEFPNLTVEEIRSDSEQGKKLVNTHNITVFPGIIVNGQYYTSGGVDEEELRNKLK